MCNIPPQSLILTRIPKSKNKKHLLYIQEEQKQTCKNFSRFYTSQIVALNDVKIDIDLTKSKTIEYEI